MSKYLVLFALLLSHASVLLGKETDVITRDLGDFTVKAYNDTDDNHWKMKLYKKCSDEVFQLLKNVPQSPEESKCDINMFLGNYTNKQGEKYDFMYICDFESTPESYKYTPRTMQFVSNEFAFGPALDEFKTLKHVYLGVSYSTRYDWEEEPHELSIYIFNKSSENMTQRIDIACDSEHYVNDCETTSLEIGDYNFDGFDDFKLVDSYYLYNPTNNTFLLSEIVGHNLAFDHKNKTITDSYWDRWLGHEFTTVYKIVDNKMVAILKTCFANIGFNEVEVQLHIEDCDSFSGTKYHLRSIKLNKNFELHLTILDNESKKAVVIYKGQQEYINLELQRKSDTQRVYNEVMNGKITGTYIINDGTKGINGAYIRARDGRRFELENAWY